MTATILDGNAIRDQIFAELQREIAALRSAGIRPGLAAVLVGDNPASRAYVKSKIAACEKLGLGSWQLEPPKTFSTTALLEIIADLNQRDEVDGILVQLPLPPKSTPNASSNRSILPRMSTASIRSISDAWLAGARRWWPVRPPA